LSATHLLHHNHLLLSTFVSCFSSSVPRPTGFYPCPVYRTVVVVTALFLQTQFFGAVLLFISPNIPRRPTVHCATFHPPLALLVVMGLTICTAVLFLLSKLGIIIALAKMGRNRVKNLACCCNAPVFIIFVSIPLFIAGDDNTSSIRNTPFIACTYAHGRLAPEDTRRSLGHLAPLSPMPLSSRRTLASSQGSLRGLQLPPGNWVSLASSRDDPEVQATSSQLPPSFKVLPNFCH
jgi:hypothetical protein